MYISDSTLTIDSVAEVMELVNDWNSLDTSVDYGTTNILVPCDRFEEIQKRCSTKREVANECASYYVHCHPQPS